VRLTVGVHRFISYLNNLAKSKEFCTIIESSCITLVVYTSLSDYTNMAKKSNATRAPPSNSTHQALSAPPKTHVHSTKPTPESHSVAEDHEQSYQARSGSPPPSSAPVSSNIPPAPHTTERRVRPARDESRLNSGGSLNDQYADSSVQPSASSQQTRLQNSTQPSKSSTNIRPSNSASYGSAPNPAVPHSSTAQSRVPHGTRPSEPIARPRSIDGDRRVGKASSSNAPQEAPAARLPRSKESAPLSDQPKDPAPLSNSHNSKDLEQATHKLASDDPSYPKTASSHDKAKYSTIRDNPIRSTTPPKKGSHTVAPSTKHIQQPRESSRAKSPAKPMKSMKSSKPSKSWKPSKPSKPSKPIKPRFWRDLCFGVPDPETVKENIEYHNTPEVVPKKSVAVPGRTSEGLKGRKEEEKEKDDRSYKARDINGGWGKRGDEQEKIERFGGAVERDRYRDRPGDEELPLEKSRTENDDAERQKRVRSKPADGRGEEVSGSERSDYVGLSRGRSESGDMTQSRIQHVKDTDAGREDRLALHERHRSGLDAGRKNASIGKDKKGKVPKVKEEGRRRSFMREVTRGGKVIYETEDENEPEVEDEYSGSGPELKGELRGRKDKEINEDKRESERRKNNQYDRRRADPEISLKPRVEVNGERDRVKKGYEPRRGHGSDRLGDGDKGRENDLAPKGEAVRGKEGTKTDDYRLDRGPKTDDDHRHNRGPKIDDDHRHDSKNKPKPRREEEVEERRNLQKVRGKR
jgi:hypothetical protein